MFFRKRSMCCLHQRLFELVPLHIEKALFKCECGTRGKMIIFLFSNIRKSIRSSKRECRPFIFSSVRNIERPNPFGFLFTTMLRNLKSKQLFSEVGNDTDMIQRKEIIGTRKLPSLIKGEVITDERIRIPN